MMTYLKTKGLWIVVEQDPPTEQDAVTTWQKKDLEALNAIVQTLSTVQTSYVINQTSARGVWNKLEEVSRGRILERRLNLKRKLNTIKWEKGENATQYMQRLESITEELRSMGETFEDVEVASIALQGLPKAYFCVARSFDACSMKDVTPEKVKYALLQEESRQENSSEVAAYKTVFVEQA